ncbi:DUF6311 domain-containing protein [uncultured Sphingomonas sp.]|uniref:DUF6311 domain-containing protein n=1 Tax=uncultured Sphingomonas sp. TaxID=158754 RepID=UPI0035CB3F0B
MAIDRFAARQLSLAALAAVIFVAWMHPAILDVRNVGWLLDGSDRGQTAIGLAAYLRGGSWPALHNPLLLAPEGLPLSLTDSNPLLGLLCRPLGLPADWQVIGWWLLVCVVLQVAFANALLRRHVADPLALFLGTALVSFSPTLIARYGHVNLCAHWTILWALWIFVDETRAKQPAWWMAVIGVSLLIHPYLAVMTGAIWASAVIRLIILHRDRSSIMIAAGAVAASVLAIAWWLGLIGQSLVSSGTYGRFGIALDGLWNPGNPDYSALLPGVAASPAQGFEGFNYLGAGMLVLVALAVIALLFGRGRSAGLSLTWLIPAFGAFALIAIGPHLIWRGQVIASIPVAAGLRDALDPVRAAGRLFWPVGYVIALTAVVIVARLPRGALMIGGALALQVIDLAPMLAAVRATSARADDHRLYLRTRDPRWQSIIDRASAIEFYPIRSDREKAVVEELAWRAITAPRPVLLRYFYASREPAAVAARLDADAAAFRAGRIDRSRLYVLLDGRASGALAGRVTIIDGLAVIVPDAAVIPSSPRSAS